MFELRAVAVIFVLMWVGNYTVGGAVICAALWFIGEAARKDAF